jgi:hypothetical protein
MTADSSFSGKAKTGFVCLFTNYVNIPEVGFLNKENVDCSSGT